MPLKEDLWKAYRNYYTHTFEGGTLDTRVGNLRRLYRAAKAGYLTDRYGYPEEGRGGSRALGKLLRLALPLSSRIDAEIRYLPFVPEGRLLDVGCGSGSWLRYMRDLGWQAE